MKLQPYSEQYHIKAIFVYLTSAQQKKVSLG